MSLGTLPIDGICLIADLLDLESLSRLFATLNRRIQNLLSSPSVSHSLDLNDSQREFSLKGHHLAYYLQSLSNIRSLNFDRNPSWNLFFIKWLSRLNPTKLFMDVELLCQNLILHQPGSSNGGDENILKSPLPPAFQRLTNLSLYHKIHPNTLQKVVKLSDTGSMLFPATLTSISFLHEYAPPQQALLKVLPTNLKSLSLHIDQSERSFTSQWSRTLSRFTELERLRFEFDLIGITTDLTFTSDILLTLPPTLLDLKFQQVVADASFFKALNRLISTCPQLHTLFINNARRLPYSVNQLRMVEIADLACPSLLHLTYNTKPRSAGVDVFDICQPPPFINTLVITVSRHWNTLLNSIMTLKSLETLRLTSSDGRGFVLSDRAADEIFELQTANNVPFAIYRLPPSIQDLEFDNVTSPTQSEIEWSPSNLRSLAVSHCHLSRHSDLLKRSPLCKLTIIKDVRIWHTENAEWCSSEMNQDEDGMFDVNAWISALERKASLLNIRCQLDFNRYDLNVDGPLQFPPSIIVLKFDNMSDPRMVWDLKFFLPATKQCFKLEKLDLRTRGDFELPSSFLNLTHLELHDSTIKHLPTIVPSLQHLSSSQAKHNELLKLPANMHTHLTHLDVPQLKLKWSVIAHCNFDNLKMLRFTLTDVADFMVVEFLTRRLNHQARLNTSLAIEYFVTGSLLPESGPKATRHVTWTSMVEETDVILKSQLSNRMPSGFNLSRQDTSHTAALQDTVGSCVTSLTQVPRKGFYLSQIVLPRSSHSIQLDTGLPLQMTNSKRSQECFGALEPSFSDDDNERDCRLTPIFGHSIVLLDVSNVTRLSQWIPCLPPTLKHLSFSPAYEESCGFIVNCNFPPSLITLIIRWRHEKPFDILAPFKRHQHIPRSLEHLALRAKYFPYYNRQTDFPSSEEDSSELPANASLLLPNLKTLYLPIVSQRCLDYYWNKVSSPTLERFIITTDGFVAPKTDKYSGKLLIETSPKSLITEMLAKMHLDGIVASNSSSSSAPSITAPTLFDANPTTPTVLSPFSSTSSLETQFGGIKLSNNETSSTSGFGTPTSSIASQFASSASPSILDNNPSGATQTTRKKAVRRK